MAETDTQDAGLEALPRLVEELSITPRQIMSVAKLLAEGNTIPFIARYRKEVHGNLDEVQISKIQERLNYYTELEERRATILKSIEEQGKLTDELKRKIGECTSKTVLEDLYLPYKPKRRTRAMIAREKGLEPLAALILAQGVGSQPDSDAAAFVSEEKGVADTAAALAGGRDIVAEMISENADVRGLVRQAFAADGVVVSEVVDPKPAEPTKFEQYYDFQEKVSAIPSHRFLAIRRGQAEGVLRVRLMCEAEPRLRRIEEIYKLNVTSSYAPHLKAAIEDGYKRLIAPSVEIDVTVEMKMKSDRAAVEIFAENLRNLLLQAPLGEQKIIGIDPGLRTGCKCVALDATGKFLETCTVYPTQGDRKEIEAKVDICKMVSKYRPYAIAVGNGTGGRETEAFVRGVLKEANVKDVLVISVNEAGASVYSASEVARDEFPELDLTIRGAISIGRRLQDPLAELVKIDPKAIGVGQYQHDVHQPLLVDKLDEVVVSCVNHVGVELNTASAPLLTRVSGIGGTMAKKIVSYRNENGAFTSRKQLSKVPGLGPKTFEQAAGFLRIRGGLHPLDASAVHPERYALVEQMATELGVSLAELIGNVALIDKIPLAKYVSETVGEPTLRDIIAELKKPGRDPRATFEKPAFRDDVTEFEHVKEGMVLEGIVTNVTAFGAFVDIGVHQDGLVHVSELSDRFIRDPAEAVKTGDKLKVRVLSVDKARRRIALSAKSQSSGPRPSAPRQGGPAGRDGSPNRPSSFPRGGGQPPRQPPRSGFSANPFAGL
ncbi:MAG TPA: Tex family protein [Kiritimatiellia bacterium]|nr:Tex family protein [Kiritimatiellia bacterium]HPS06364.1 Tex family protein [Kiritimatiellia bacterium]